MNSRLSFRGRETCVIGAMFTSMYVAVAAFLPESIGCGEPPFWEDSFTATLHSPNRKSGFV